MLSKIERGQVFPTLPTLLRISMVFGVGLDHFFSDANARRTLTVVRRQDRLRLPERPGETAPAYFFESLNFPATDRLLDAYLAVFPVKGPPSARHRHDGAELVFVLAGQIAVTVAETEVLLAEGDALYFDPDAPHSYGTSGNDGGTALVVVTAGGAATQDADTAAAT
jgi:quercetin dioxygenase-like cupin family protein